VFPAVAVFPVCLTCPRPSASTVEALGMAGSLLI
jgi:hypothetical protein